MAINGETSPLIRDLNPPEKWGVGEEHNLSVASYYGGKYSESPRIVKAGIMMEYYLWNYLVFYKSFYKTGFRSATRPALIMVIVAIFAAALSGGVFMRVFERDPSVLNLSETAPSTLNKHLFEESFEEKTAQLIISPREGVDNLLTKNILLELMTVYETVLDVSVEKEDALYNYPGICSKAMGSCQTYGILGFWGFDRARLAAQDEETLGEVVASQATYDFGAPIQLSDIAGGVVFGGEEVSSIAAYKFYFPLRHESGDDWSEVQLSWQKKFMEEMEKLESTNIEVSWLTSASREVSSQDQIDSDWTLIVISFVLVILLGMLSLARTDLIRSRSFLVLGAVVHSVMAYAVATGLSGYMGTPDVPANRFCIIITLFFALDHVFMLVRNFSRADPSLNFAERVAIAEQHTGMQLFLVGLNVFVSYMAGSLYPLEGFHSFFLRLGLCIMMEQQFFLTWFCACLGLDARRSESHRVDCLPCVKASHVPLPSHPSREDMFAEHTPLTRLYAALLVKKGIKFLVILITLAMVAVGAYGMASFDATKNFSLAGLYPDESSGSDFYAMDEMYFNEVPSDVFIVLNGVDYEDPATEPLLDQLIFNMTASAPILPGSLLAWYPAYLGFKTPGAFYNDLALFLQAEGSQFNRDIVLNEEGKIQISRFRAKVDPTEAGSRFTGAETQLEVKKEIEELCEIEGLDSFAFALDWPAYYEAPKIRAIIYEVIFVSIFTLAGMEAIFVPPTIVASILVSALFTTVGVIGFLSLVGLGINESTGYWIFLSWGLSTEYGINFLYDFMSVPGTDRDYRAERALSLGSTSILPAIIATVLCVVPLLFGSSPLTQTFPLVLWAVVFLSVWNAFVFMPVVHSLVGSRSINSYSFGKLPCV